MEKHSGSLDLSPLLSNQRLILHFESNSPTICHLSLRQKMNGLNHLMKTEGLFALKCTTIHAFICFLPLSPSQKKCCVRVCVCVTGHLVPKNKKLTGDVPLISVISPQNSWPPARALAHTQSASISDILAKASAAPTVTVYMCLHASVCVCVAVYPSFFRCFIFAIVFESLLSPFQRPFVAKPFHDQTLRSSDPLFSLSLFNPFHCASIFGL